MRFKGKVALITAAASGIGRATAEMISREGGVVVGVDNNRSKLDVVIDAITMAGAEARGYVVDAMDQGQVDAVVSAIGNTLGRIDILVNGVGGSTIVANPAAETRDLTFAEWQAIVDFNLNGTFLFCHAVIPIMQKQKYGKIVNIGSIAGRGRNAASSSGYAAAKGGIVAFTTKLAHELGPHGINVNAIAPSVTLTERMRPRWEERSAEARAQAIETTPLRRISEPIDQARVICFLASQDADFVTGVTIDVTGGL